VSEEAEEVAKWLAICHGIMLLEQRHECGEWCPIRKALEGWERSRA
jgi:hypothetical protein